MICMLFCFSQVVSQVSPINISDQKRVVESSCLDRIGTWYAWINMFSTICMYLKLHSVLLYYFIVGFFQTKSTKSPTYLRNWKAICIPSIQPHFPPWVSKHCVRLEDLWGRHLTQPEAPERLGHDSNHYHPGRLKQTFILGFQTSSNGGVDQFSDINALICACKFCCGPCCFATRNGHAV